MADYLTHWLDHVAVHTVRPSPLACYRTCARLYLIPALGSKKLTRLTAKDIRVWLDRLRTTCRCCALGRCCQQYLSPLTIVYLHAPLRSALQHAVREDDLTRTIARNVQVSAGRRQRIEPLTTAEARHLPKFHFG